MVILPDYLSKNLKVVFCGTAVGNKSADAGCYYSAVDNKFWTTLHNIGLTPRQLDACEDSTVIKYGIGLTDLAKDHSGVDAQIPTSGYLPLVTRKKIIDCSPKVLAFNGKKAVRKFHSWDDDHNVEYGPLSAEYSIEKTSIWVLPSTSPMAKAHWDLNIWERLADHVGRWGAGR